MLSSPLSSPFRSTQEKDEPEQAKAPLDNSNQDAALSPMAHNEKTAGRQTQQTQQSVQGGLSEPFAPFQHQDLLVGPYEGELRKDIEFQEHLNQLLLEMILEFHAWSTSRPEFESATAGDALFEETQGIMKTEQEQGMFSFSFEQARQRLLEFISRIKSALATLTGLVI